MAMAMAVLASTGVLLLAPGSSAGPRPASMPDVSMPDVSMPDVRLAEACVAQLCSTQVATKSLRRFDRIEPQTLAFTDQGRAITAYRIGSPDASTRLVVVGQIHGNEVAGAEVAQELLRRSQQGAGLVQLGHVTTWLIVTLNPDGQRQRTRINARGVDLNRNFPASWRQAGRGTSQWSGPAAASETEVQALMKFLDQVQPTAVVALHQDYAVVDLTHRRSRPAGRALATLLGLPARPVGCSGRCHGTLTEWVDRRFQAIALTVELPGRVDRNRVRQYADDLEAFAAWLGRQAPR